MLSRFIILGLLLGSSCQDGNSSALNELTTPQARHYRSTVHDESLRLGAFSDSRIKRVEGDAFVTTIDPEDNHKLALYGPKISVGGDDTFNSEITVSIELEAFIDEPQYCKWGSPNGHDLNCGASFRIEATHSGGQPFVDGNGNATMRQDIHFTKMEPLKRQVIELGNKLVGSSVADIEIRVVRLWTPVWEDGIRYLPFDQPFTREYTIPSPSNPSWLDRDSADFKYENVTVNFKAPMEWVKIKVYETNLRVTYHRK